MRNQQAKSVADVLLNDPNVRVARGFGNFQEVFMIRGFPAYSDDMTYNGIYGILPRQFVAAEYMERVELFRGASAFLNGAAPGGPNATNEAMSACSAARATLSMMSRRNAVFRSAASIGVSGGDNRVLVWPGIDAFAMIAIAQHWPIGFACAGRRSIRQFPAQIALNLL